MAIAPAVGEGPAPPDAAEAIAARLLEGVLAEHEGPDHADVLRSLLHAARGDALQTGGLAAEVGARDTRSLGAVARGAGVQLALLNIAADHRDHAREEDVALGERCAPAAPLPELDVRLVLTAHPTDIARRSVLSKRHTVARCLEALAGDRLDRPRRRRLEEDLGEALSIWYATDEIRGARPRVADEVRRLLWFFETTIYDAAAAFAQDHELAALDTGRPGLRFGSWAGGDMDGNPHVTPATILDTLRAHRLFALRMLIERTVPLRLDFSHSAARLALRDELTASLARDEQELSRTSAALASEYPHESSEPLRRKLAYVVARLRHTLAAAAGEDPPEPGYTDPDALARDLELVRESVGSRSVMRGRLDRLIWQVRIFGFHLATLEVRADAAELQAACRALLPGYGAAGSETARAALLTDGCSRGELPPRGADPAPRPARALDAIAQAIAAHGPAAVDTFIVSNAERPSDLLCALWLARRSGLFTPALRPAPGSDRDSKIEIVPLFERRGALAEASQTLGVLYGNRAYRQQLAARGNRQEVMVGFSDAGKDMGYVPAQWAIHETQERLARQARERGIRLRLFHGRGGSTPRGGGSADAVYRSIVAQPADTIDGALKITIQGEVVSARFADHRTAVRSLSRTAAAIREASAGSGGAVDSAWRSEMSRIARAAWEAHEQLVRGDRDLPALFESCTPVDVLDALNIGSRPGRRAAASGVALGTVAEAEAGTGAGGATAAAGGGWADSLRAIPWVFAWTQTRIGLPGWYGAGSGLAAGDLGRQREMHACWPFFATLIENLQAALDGVDLIIGERYLALAEDPAAARRVWRLIRREHDLCAERLAAIRVSPAARAAAGGQDAALRGAWLDVLAHVQIELLRRHRAGEPAARDAVLATISAIAAGLRTTG